MNRTQWLKELQPGKRVAVHTKNTKIFRFAKVEKITTTGMFRLEGISIIFQANGENGFYRMEPVDAEKEARLKTVRHLQGMDWFSLSTQQLYDILKIISEGDSDVAKS